jgi:hypothetical protein
LDLVFNYAEVLMAQFPFQSNSNLTPELKSFMVHYLRFGGYHPEDLPPQTLNSELGDRAVSRSLDLSPWLMGAGSLAATLVIGTLLSEQANSQLQSQAPDPLPPDQAAERSPTAATPQDTRISLVPTPPEVMESAAVQAARRPFRDQLAEWLQTQQKPVPSPYADRLPTVAVAASVPPSVPEIDISDRPASPSAPSSAATAEPSVTVASPSSVAVSPSAPAADTIASFTDSNPSVSAQPLFAAEQDLSRVKHMRAQPSVVLSSDVLAQPYGIAAPERIATQPASAVQLSRTTIPVRSASVVTQPATCVAADRPTHTEPSATQTVKAENGLAKQLGTAAEAPAQKSLARLVALSPETAAQSRLHPVAPLQVVHLSPQDYQQLWTAASPIPASAPTHGFIDYQQQIVVLPDAPAPVSSCQTEA